MIKVENLTQTYRSGKGIFNLSFEIKEGEVFGYLGPNGAGKTTTIRNLMGFANADSDSAVIRNLDCRSQAADIQDFAGYLPGEMAFFDNLTGFQFLKFIGDMRKTRDSKLRDDLIDRLELETNVKIKQMSRGMKQKPGIVTAFMHDPLVYILDVQCKNNHNTGFFSYIQFCCADNHSDYIRNSCLPGGNNPAITYA